MKHFSITFTFASLLAAFAASLCCILPIVFALTGISILGASAFFEDLRPYLLAVTFGLLGLGFYFAYRRNKPACAADSNCAVPWSRRPAHLLLWLIALSVVLLAAFPYYSGQVADFLVARPSAIGNLPRPAPARALFAVEGLDCAACATAIEHTVKSVRGVQGVTVSVERSTAEIHFDPQLGSLAQLETAIKDAGFRARKIW